MPPQEEAGRHQKAVLWEFLGNYDDQGQPKVTDALVELDVRWIEEDKLVTDAKGQKINLVATVTVDRKIAVGSVLAPGRKDDWDDVGTGTPSESGSLYEVATYSEVPDLKGREFYREVGLKRYRGTLPNLES